MPKKSTSIKLKPPVSLRDRVYDYVKTQIIEGSIPPSEILTEMNLSKQLGISRTPVREALHYLEKEGMLSALPKKGYKVRDIDRRELEEICEIRCALETIAAKWAIERMTKADIRPFEENIAAAQRKLDDGDLPAFVILDGEFHEMLARASGSLQLENIILSLRNDMIRSRITGLQLGGIKVALEGHRHMLQGLVEKDLSKIELAIREHLENLKRDSSTNK